MAGRIIKLSCRLYDGIRAFFIEGADPVIRRGDTLFVCFVLLCFANPALAATYRAGGASGCALAHKAAPDVAYTDGVDAKGWAVAPSDLNPPPLTAEDFSDTYIELKLPARNYVEEDASPLADSNTEINLGVIHVPQDGQAKLNGKSLAAENTEDCGENTR